MRTFLKFFVAIIGSILIFQIHTALFVLGITLLFFFYILLLPIRDQVIKRMNKIIPLGVIIVCIQIITNPSPHIYDRISYGIFVFARILFASMLIFSIMSTTSASEIMKALSFAPQTIQLLLTLLFYFIPIVFDESDKITLAQLSRGANSKSLLHLPSLLVPLLNRVFQRSQTLSLALISRGYEKKD